MSGKAQTVPAIVVDATLADTMGALYVQIATLQAQYDTMKEAVVAHGASVEGARFVADYVSSSVAWALDTKAIRAEMGEAWCIQRSKLQNKGASVRMRARMVAAA